MIDKRCINAMIKKIGIITIVLLFVSIGFSVEGNETVIIDNSTLNDTIINDTIVNDTSSELNMTDYEEDFNVLTTPPGIALRFTQLERQISIRIEQGEAVLQRVVESNLSVDVSELTSILDELELVKEEVQYYTNTNISIDTSEAAVAFVDLKKESLDLVKEFRTIVHTLLTKENIDALRERLALINETSNSNLNGKIRSLIKAHNSYKVKNALQNMGYENNTLPDDILNSNLTGNNIMQRLRNAFQNLNESVKNRVLVRIKQNITQGNVWKASVNETAKANYTVRKLERVEERIQNLENRTGNALRNMEKLRERINNKIESVKTRGNSGNSNNGASLSNNGRGNSANSNKGGKKK